MVKGKAEVFREMLAAFDRGDREAWLANCHEDSGPAASVVQVTETGTQATLGTYASPKSFSRKVSATPKASSAASPR
jgi:hypothetical protein